MDDNALAALVETIPDGWRNAMAYPVPEPPASGSFAEFVSSFAFGALWNRPQLTIRERRIAVLAILAALGRGEGLRMHVASALQLGDLTAADIEEIAVTVATYAGVAAGVELAQLNARSAGPGNG